MSEQSHGENLVPGNFELQQEFLAAEQRRISGELFESGAASRITGETERAVGATVELGGLHQLEKLFVPSLSMARSQDENDDKEEKVLSLVAITDGAAGQRSFTYFRLGMIDDTGTLFPYPGIDATDAEAVQQAANELVSAKEQAMLPNLTFDLLSISNPNTAIRATH